MSRFYAPISITADSTGQSVKITNLFDAVPGPAWIRDASQIVAGVLLACERLRVCAETWVTAVAERGGPVLDVADWTHWVAAADWLVKRGYVTAVTPADVERVAPAAAAYAALLPDRVVVTAMTTRQITDTLNCLLGWTAFRATGDDTIIGPLDPQGSATVTCP